MREYKITQEGFKKLMFQVKAAAAMLVIFPWIIVSLNMILGGELDASSPASLIFIFSAIIIFILVLIFGVKAVSNQKKQWQGFSIILDSESITKRTAGSPDITISKDFLANYKVTSDGKLILNNKFYSARIVIPKEINGYEEIKSVLASWGVRCLTGNTGLNLRNVLTPLIYLGFMLFLMVFFSGSAIVALSCGIVLTAIIIFSLSQFLSDGIIIRFFKTYLLSSILPLLIAAIFLINNYVVQPLYIKTVWSYKTIYDVEASEPKNGSYENKYIGMKMSVPNNWNIITKGMDNSIGEESIKILSGKNPIYETAYLIYLSKQYPGLAPIHEGVKITAVKYDKKATKSNLNNYIKDIRKSIVKGEYGKFTNFEKNYEKKDIGGVMFEGLCYSINKGSAKVKQKQFVSIINGYAVVVSLAYDTDDELRELEGLLKNVEFSID